MTLCTKRSMNSKGYIYSVIKHNNSVQRLRRSRADKGFSARVSTPSLLSPKQSLQLSSPFSNSFGRVNISSQVKSTCVSQCHPPLPR